MTELVTAVDSGRGVLSGGLLPNMDIDMEMETLGGTSRNESVPTVKDGEEMEASVSQSQTDCSGINSEGFKGDVDSLLDMLCDHDDNGSQWKSPGKPLEESSKTQTAKGSEDTQAPDSSVQFTSDTQHDSQAEARLSQPLEKPMSPRNEEDQAKAPQQHPATSWNRSCAHPGCTKFVFKAGLCVAHGPSRRTEGCSKVAVQRGVCLAHGPKEQDITSIADDVHDSHSVNARQGVTTNAQETKGDSTPGLLLMRSLYQEGRERRLSRKRAAEAAAGETDGREDAKKPRDASEEQTAFSPQQSLSLPSSSYSSSSSSFSSPSSSSSSALFQDSPSGSQKNGAAKSKRALELPSMQSIKQHCCPQTTTSQTPASVSAVLGGLDSKSSSSKAIGSDNDDCVFMGSFSKKGTPTSHTIEQCEEKESKRAPDAVESSPATTSAVVILDDLEDGNQKEGAKQHPPSRSADELLAASLESAGSKPGATSPPVGSDADLAAYLQQKEDSEWSAHRHMREQEDAALASMLQAEENAVMDPAKEAEQMKSTTEGRAWLLAKEVIAFCRESAEFTSKADQVEAVAIDEMVETAARFLACRDRLEKDGRPAQATIAYHYTKTHNIESIKENGLMTGEDQRKNNLGMRGGCGVYGEGLYFGGNPFAFSSYGQIGLVVAVLKGRQQRVWGRHDAAEVTKDGAVNTVIGNKRLRGGVRRHPREVPIEMKNDFPSEPSKEIAHHDEFVLQETCQCFPMVRFNQTMVSQNDDSSSGNRLVWTIHQELQKILDSMVNNGKATPLERVFPSVVRTRANFRARIPPSLPPPPSSNQPIPLLTPPNGGLPNQPFSFPPSFWQSGMATGIAGTIPTPATVFGVPFHPVPLAKQTAGQGAAPSSTFPSSSSQPTGGDTTTTLHSIPLSPPQTAMCAPQPFVSGLASSSTSSGLFSGASQATTQSSEFQASSFSQTSFEPTRLSMLTQASGILLSPLAAQATMVQDPALSLPLSSQGTGLGTGSMSTSPSSLSQSSFPVPNSSSVPTLTQSTSFSLGQSSSQQALTSSCSTSSPPLSASANLATSSSTALASSQMPALASSTTSSVSTLPANQHTTQTSAETTATQKLPDCTQSSAPDVSASIATKAALESQDFVLFLRILMQLLEQRDPALHTRATAVLEDCKEKHKAGDPSYASLADSLEKAMRQLVGQGHWKDAETNFDAVKALEQQRLRQMQMEIELKRLELQRQRRELSMQILHGVPQQGPTAQAASGSNVGTQGMIQMSSSQSFGQKNEDTSYREEITYTAPESIPDKGDALQTTAIAQCKTNECSICMDTFRATKEVVRLRECGHEFHRECMQASLKRQSTCPICRRSIRGEPQGTSPSGTMTVTKSTTSCSGFEPSHSLVIDYSLPAGVQKAYHDNPGVPYASTKRTAYLPDNSEGQKLLKRLKYAWSKGLTFTIGTSLTTGRPNSIVWSSIHHKSGYSGGSHSFPDPTFFSDVNQELDTLCVPKFDQCP